MTIRLSIPLRMIGLALALGVAEPVLAQSLSPDAAAIVSDTRSSPELSDKQLRQRLQTLRTALDQTDLSEELRKELRSLLRADRAEQDARSATADAGAAAPDTTEVTSPDTGTSAGSTTLDAAGGGTASATIDTIVSTTSPSSDLSDEALQGRLAEIDAGLAQGDLPRALRRQLASLQAADQAEIERRRAAVTQEQTSAGEEEPLVAAASPDDEPAPSSASIATSEPDAAAEPAASPSKTSGNLLGDARALLSSSSNPRTLSTSDLRERLSDARQLLANRKLPGNLRGKLTDLSAKLRSEIRRRDATAANQDSTATTTGSATRKQSIVVADNTSGGQTLTQKKRAGTLSAADRQALTFLNDKTRAERLPRAELRKRLDIYRALLASRQLSPQVAKDLRAKLARERTLLREKVTVEEVQTTKAKSKSNRAAPKVVMREPTTNEAPRLATDRRRATELNEVQLNRRIKAFRVLNRSDRTSAAERAAYREKLRADRAELRRRLLEDKRRRAAAARRAPRLTVDVDLGRNAGVTLWAAEAGDEEIERQLTARPVRRLRQRYSRRIILADPEPIVTREEVRDSLPSVEIDTINFGFNESFVGEEEIAALDRIGSILERILSDHPDEVFLIEGHTDAVGSDEYNLRLSRERARAVKEALVDYYAISPDSLSVVGLGERYLKIPTLEPEEENRRVTVRRLTPLLSEYDPY
ncbi:MAG: OmpA family protein [Hyphomicrobiaceae bacterium]